MQINADFDQGVCVRTDDLPWQASPMAGVDRRMLDRIGDEVARATSIVRYAKGSAFPEHTHSGGEEFIVLDGVFQDEHGDYPAGTYVRNPVGTHHVPGSAPGCTIFVKLWQFAPADQEQIALDLNAVTLKSNPARTGVRSAVLADRTYEQVALEEWAPGASIELADKGGFEILILAGKLIHDGASYKTHDWLRIPAQTTAQFAVGDTPARIWIKRGHLTEIRVPPQS